MAKSKSAVQPRVACVYWSLSLTLANWGWIAPVRPVTPAVVVTLAPGVAVQSVAIITTVVDHMPSAILVVAFVLSTTKIAVLRRARFGAVVVVSWGYVGSADHGYSDSHNEKRAKQSHLCAAKSVCQL